MSSPICLFCHVLYLKPVCKIVFSALHVMKTNAKTLLFFYFSPATKKDTSSFDEWPYDVTAHVIWLMYWNIIAADIVNVYSIRRRMQFKL